MFNVDDDVTPILMADKGVNVYPLELHREENPSWTVHLNAYDGRNPNVLRVNSFSF
jgi:hypothetical protein